MARSKAARKTAAPSNQAESSKSEEGSHRAARETIESIAVAIILAFLFRAFVAEAFVIPTGSMAPTLQGRHMDVVCEMCGYPYRTGASQENDGTGQVVGTTCPICRYTMVLDKEKNPNQRSFNGDRILVSKFAYEVSDPKRWDVIVFKYPGNAKQNYIKRLVGLPNEVLRIRHGDIYTRPLVGTTDQRLRIARKPAYKLRAMLQIVHDTNYRSELLAEMGWPDRWQDWSSPDAPGWLPRDGGPGYETTGAPQDTTWLRYRHVVPWNVSLPRPLSSSSRARSLLQPGDSDWQSIADGKVPVRLAAGTLQGQLITDYYAYNNGIEDPGKYMDPFGFKAMGLHWVGDLAVEAEDLQVEGDSGTVSLDLVEGGVHYTCRIDVATGEAVLSIDGGRGAFVDDLGNEVFEPRAATKLRGPGSYDLRFSNCDDQLLLWVNDRVVEFDGPTTYTPLSDVRPAWSEQDPGDLEPAGIGAQGVSLKVERLRVLRDVYYVASSYEIHADDDYDESFGFYQSEQERRLRFIRDTLASPEQWATTPLFESRRAIEFEMGEDQFFPLGDNSPQSRDARLWSQLTGLGGEPYPRAYVTRDLLIGKALVIYWPHAWRRPVPLLPNFARMGLIR
jgi:signal peptidase I